MIIIFIVVAAVAILSLIGVFGLMRGSADEQAAYEKAYREYIAKQKKQGIDLE
jgi:hypothetical protein